MNVGDKIRLEIDRLSIGGRGVGRYTVGDSKDGIVVFVPNTAPGDVVEVGLTEVKKKFAEGEVLHVLEPGPSRITPPCPFAGTCGGCSWQHVEYEEQLRQKHELVFQSLRRHSGFELKTEDVAAVVPSPKPLRYRNRIQIHYDGIRLGYHQRGTNQIVNIDDCLIAENELVKKFSDIRNKPARKKGQRIEILRDRSGRVEIRDVEGDPESLEDSPFSQVNEQQNKNLIALLIEKLKAAAHELEFEPANVVDLYAGNGNLTFPLAQAFPNSDVTGVESNGKNVNMAQSRSHELNLDSRLAFVKSEVESYLKNVEWIGPETILVLDPPRTGATEMACRAILSARPKLVAYVSCHPVTLARDLKFFQTAGYAFSGAWPLDMFPQTDHVETLVLLASP